MRNKLSLTSTGTTQKPLGLVGATNLKEGVMLGKSPLSFPFYMHSISPFHSILVQRHRFSLRRVSLTGFTVEVLVQPLCSIIILFLIVRVVSYISRLSNVFPRRDGI